MGGRIILVKREDLCSPRPGPVFAKIRGVEAHLAKIKAQTIGVLDTYHSKAGWGVSFVCRELGRKSVVFYPEYRDEPGPREPQRMAVSLGARLIPLQAGRSAILYHTAKKRLLADFPGSYMMPNALKLQESVEATMKEVWNTPKDLFKGGTWIISVSSGTMAAGVIKGLIWKGARVQVILHMGYSRSEQELRAYVTEMVGGIIPKQIPLRVVDEGYEYKDRVSVDPPVPFPCNEYYDLKAWKWLQREAGHLAEPIVFWNIGE